MSNDANKAHIGLVLQGGGALGAYEYGAVTQLVKEGFIPKIISGVSIGAINTAVIAGARNGDIVGSLHALWERITFKNQMFVPEYFQKYASMMGNPAFYKNRSDWWLMQEWTALCDTSPILATLKEVVDFERLNDTNNMRVAVTATNVATGAQVTFSNTEERLRAEHIVASGSLPPGFPATEIDGEHYWDGGLFDNTPLSPVLALLTDEEAETLPIVTIDLVPSADAVPCNLQEVKNRMMELSFENRFWDEFGGPLGLIEHAHMLKSLEGIVPRDHPIRQNKMFQRLMNYRALRNLKVIPSGHQAMSDGMDFSYQGVQGRYKAGVTAVKRFLESRQLPDPKVVVDRKSQKAGSPKVDPVPSVN